MSPTSNPDVPAANPQAARYPSLQGRRVFVTGGATGIGAAVVAALARQGAQVAFVDVAASVATHLGVAARGAGRSFL